MVSEYSIVEVISKEVGATSVMGVVDSDTMWTNHVETFGALSNIHYNGLHHYSPGKQKYHGCFAGWVCAEFRPAMMTNGKRVTNFRD